MSVVSPVGGGSGPHTLLMRIAKETGISFNETICTHMFNTVVEQHKELEADNAPLRLPPFPSSGAIVIPHPCAAHASVSRSGADAAREQLARPGVQVEPRKMWPAGMSDLGIAASGKIGANLLADPERSQVQLYGIPLSSPVL